MFDRVWSRVFRVIDAQIFVMLGSYETTVRASVEETILSEMSKVVTLGAEGFSTMFCWGVFEG